MKLIAATLALTLASCAASPSRALEEMTTAEKSNHIALYVGQRNLDEDDYEPVDEQLTVGVEYVREAPDSAIGFEVGLMGSGDDGHAGGADVEGATGELYAGIRKSFGTSVVRPYVGGGLAYIRSAIDVEGFDDVDDSSIAGYAHAGLTVDIVPSFCIGLDLRFLFASDLEFEGFETDADYAQLALVFGFAF